MSIQPSVPHDTEFTSDDLLVILQTLEVAVQTEGFIDTTSSGAASPAEKAEFLADMDHVRNKAQELYSQLLADKRTAHLWNVWPVDQDGSETASVSEFWAATAAGAVAQAADMAVADDADFAGWKVIRIDDVRTHIGAAEETEPSA